jgi:hypothetical protein
MDSAADSLLALSNVAVIAGEDEPLTDDDERSSSLSELEDDMEDAEGEDDEEEIEPPSQIDNDNDSEAETERLQVTPENLLKKKPPFEISPSKLSQRQDVDMRPEIESLTESPVSSPMSSHDDSESDASLSDGPDEPEDEPRQEIQPPLTSPNKRKRESSASDVDEAPRSQKRRTGSPESDDDKSDAESEVDDTDTVPAPQIPDIEVPDADEDVAEALEDERKEVDKTDTSEDSKGQKRRQSRRKGKDAQQPEAEEDAEVQDQSDVQDENDTEMAQKSEEEQAQRAAAMDTLMTMEKHFAALRDRLYDERIAAINNELQLLQQSKPAHPELLRQLEVVHKHRDEKFEIEQKLLVYKVGALKNKAVAERSQLHSQYFQTVRDIRERHLERISEHFYRIQRDRFKADSSIPSYTIPFPEKKSQQILHQTAINTEVSVLSGVAKYVGFPAAPKIEPRQKDIEEDIYQRLGVSSTPPTIHTTRTNRLLDLTYPDPPIKTFASSSCPTTTTITDLCSTSRRAIPGTDSMG